VCPSSFLWSHTDSFPVSTAYKFAVAGEYSVNVANGFNYQDASGAPINIDANVSSSYSVKVQGKLDSLTVSKRAMSFAKRFLSYDCDSERSAKINEAITAAITYLDDAIKYLTPLTGSNGWRYRYILWWGESRRLASVDDV